VALRPDAERPIDDSAAPIRCKEGELIGCVLVFRDITENRQVDEARRAATRELRHTLDTAAVGLTRCSRDMKYVAANAAYAKLIGMPVEQIVGRTIVDVIGNEAFALIRPQIDRVLRGERVEFELEVPWSDAASRWTGFSPAMRSSLTRPKPVSVVVTDESYRCSPGGGGVTGRSAGSAAPSS